MYNRRISKSNLFCFIAFAALVLHSSANSLGIGNEAKEHLPRTTEAPPSLMESSTPTPYMTTLPPPSPQDHHNYSREGIENLDIMDDSFEDSDPTEKSSPFVSKEEGVDYKEILVSPRPRLVKGCPPNTRCRRH